MNLLAYNYAATLGLSNGQAVCEQLMFSFNLFGWLARLVNDTYHNIKLEKTSQVQVMVPHILPDIAKKCLSHLINYVCYISISASKSLRTVCWSIGKS